MAPRMPKPVEAIAERLIATLDPKRPGAFAARLESTSEEIVCSSRQPLVDGARELLARGFDPATPLTMRMEGKAYDSFQPLPIGRWARWSYTEGEKTPLRSVPWRPNPAVAERQKSGSEAPAGTGGYPEANSLLRLDRDTAETITTGENLL